VFGSLFHAHGRSGPARLYPRLALIYAAAAAMVIVAGQNSRLLPPSLFRAAGRHDRVLFYRETAAGSVVASEDLNTGIRACYVNNSPVCGTTYDALKAVKMLGHLPFLVNPRARQVLVVGFGIGVTASALARHGAETIDCVEICPGVRDAAVYFAAYNRYVLRDPKVKFIPGDGRNVLLLSRKKYDVISCDPTHPTLGCGNLYTREYFELYRQRLNPGGVVSQYLPLHKLTTEEFRSLVRTFASAFPHATVWLGHSHGILLGSDREFRLDFKDLRDFLARTGDDILDDPYLFATALIMDEKAVAEFVRGAPLHCDDRPFLEFFDPQSLRPENWELNLAQIMSRRSDPVIAFSGIPEDTLRQYRSGQNRFIAGLICQSRGDLPGMLAEYKIGNTENPQNRELKLFLEDAVRQQRYFQGREK
jgi:spermidine synthase